MKTRTEGMTALALALLLVLPPVSSLAEARAGGSAHSRDVLEIHEVLDSVDRTYPLLLAAELERNLAAGALLEARGSFDTRVRARGEAAPSGFYDRYTADLEVDQQTRLWGSRLFGGYRIGRGDFPSYLGGRKTNEIGELRAGLEIPLLKDGPIDAQRLQLRMSEIRRRSAEPTIELRRVVITREASEAYWRWVATGLTVGTEQRLRDVATARRDQLERQLATGAIPRIVLTDNQRLIVDREIRLQTARLKFREAGLDLSLFLRDTQGDMVVPGSERLPEGFPPESTLDDEVVARDVERARTSHPLTREYRFRIQELEARLAGARNQVLPDVRFRLEASQDVGTSSSGIDSSGRLSNNPKDDTEVKALLKFELPILQRSARGQVVGRRAELAQLKHRGRFASDQIETEIRRASTNVDTAYAQTILARENAMLANQLQLAEERKLSLGSSNLIDVNIRETQATDAARRLILAQAEYFQSLARYRAAVALPAAE